MGKLQPNGCVRVQRKQIVRQKEETASTENAQGPPGMQGWAGLRCSSGPLHTCSASLLSLPGPHQRRSLHLKSLALIPILSQFGGELALLLDRGALGAECVFEIVFCEMTNFGITGLELLPHFPSHFVSFSASIQSRFCRPVAPKPPACVPGLFAHPRPNSPASYCATTTNCVLPGQQSDSLLCSKHVLNRNPFNIRLRQDCSDGGSMKHFSSFSLFFKSI